MTPKTNGFHHLAIRARDFDATLTFYTEAIGLVVRYTWGEAEKRAALLDAGNGNWVEVFANGSPEIKPESALVHFAFRVDDVDTATARARAAGAEITVEPKDFTIQSDPNIPVRLAFCKGPDGELIEFFQNSLT
jgi:glyoxylase I family protein